MNSVPRKRPTSQGKWQPASVGAIILLLLCLGSATDQVQHVISPHSGIPTLYRNAEPQPAIILFEQDITDRYADDFWSSGFQYYSSNETNRFLDLGWTGPSTFDLTAFNNALQRFAARLPDGYWLPRLHLWAPEWWLDAHPSEQVTYIAPADKLVYQRFANEERGEMAKAESFASEVWKQEAGEGLRRLVRHIMASQHRNRVMGIHLAAGAGGEWHHWTPKFLPDSSEPMLRYFRNYLRQKYKDLASLQAAWAI